ncbi:MAG: hypothetical protein H6983_18935 [Ectothiorhodospiraceae bacterium]|nr:hypothetical protein [Ectothiorhodospiraceae bacterium]
MQVTACSPYHAVSAGRSVIRMADGRSVFKVYYVDIIGRDDPTRYEWALASQDKATFEARLARLDLEGVGFVIAFPHIAKVFRFAPSAETVVHVRAFRPLDMAPLDLAREDGYVEFACLAEALVAADEYAAWAAAPDVATYLGRYARFEDAPIVDCAKLATYW